MSQKLDRLVKKCQEQDDRMKQLREELAQPGKLPFPSRMIGWSNYVRNWPNRENCLFPVGPSVVSVLLNFRTCVWIRIVPVWKVGIVLKMYPLQLYHTQIGKAKNDNQKTQTLLLFLRLPWQIVNQLPWGQRFYYLSSTIFRPNFPASLTPKSPFSLHALYQTYDTV